MRRRGVTLTNHGLRKLNQAKAKMEIELDFKRYTLESLSQETGLTPTTLSKVFTGSSGVDKRTLQCCFNAFALTLLEEDYIYLKSDQNNFAETRFFLSAENCFQMEFAGDTNNNRHRPNLTSNPCSIEVKSGLLEMSNSSQIKKMAQSPRLPTVPGGQMPVDSVFYIDRPILESICYEAIQQPDAFLKIRGPKQMGKTSLMTRILAYGKTQGYHTVSLSLQLADAEILQNLKHFLQWFCIRVSRQLVLSNAIAQTTPPAIADFWLDSLGNKANATDYFEEVILANLYCPLVIAIDELKQLFAYPDIACEFLLLLRTWSERAKTRGNNGNPWNKLRLVTVHSTEILISPSITPSLLNTGLVIELPEFNTPQVQDLANRWELGLNKQEIEQLMTLLGGHPYRLQLAFYYLHQGTITLDELLENSEATFAIYAEHLQEQWWNLQQYPELSTVFTQILRDSTSIDWDTKQLYKLQQMGLIYLQDFQVSLVCELFSRLGNNRDRPFDYTYNNGALF